MCNCRLRQKESVGGRRHDTESGDTAEHDEDDGEGVVDHEDRPGGETGKEPLDENEEDVLHDDKEGPKTGYLERFGEVEKIPPVFPPVATENMNLPESELYLRGSTDPNDVLERH